jgi:hypothetical protein
VEEIRNRAATLRPQSLPSWTFTKDRQSWHYVNAQDEGWPINGELKVKLDQMHPLLISPYAFWQAEEAPVLVIEAAFHTHQNKARVFWWKHGLSAFGAADHLDFPVQTDGQFHRCEIRLVDAPTYRGPMLRLRLDPQPDTAAEGDWVKIRSITLRHE